MSMRLKLREEAIGMFHKREIPKDKWRQFIDRMSSSVEGNGVDITIISRDKEQHQSTLWELPGVTQVKNEIVVSV